MFSPLLFLIVLETSRETRIGCQEKLLYDLAIAGESFQSLKGKLEAWKRTLESKSVRVNVQKTKMITKQSEN